MLWRKLWRDLWNNKVAYLACLVVIVLGLSVFTSMAIVGVNLHNAVNKFYTEQNFADGFISLQGMPLYEIDKLRTIPAIREIDGRIVRDVRLYEPDRADSVYLRMVSIHPDQQNAINRPLLDEGRNLSEHELALWIDPAFFRANNLNLNDKLELIIEGRTLKFLIAGTAESPEFVYAMRNMQDIYPSPDTFGVAWASFDVMASVFASGTTITDLVFTLEDGYQFIDVRERLEAVLDSYGVEAIIERENQLSNAILSQELEQLDSMIYTIPLLFLAIAAMVLYIMIRRLVEQQRGQIGILKAFGFTRMEILLHYLAYGLVLGLLGGLVGGLTGVALSVPLTQLYHMFFALPGLESSFSFYYVIQGVLLSLVFSLFATWRGSRSSVLLRPAEAMRPPTPPAAKRGILEVFPFLAWPLTLQGKMAVRNMARNKLRSVFVLFGVSVSFAMMAMSLFMWSMGDVMLGDQFTKVQTYDAKINFNRPVQRLATEAELWKLPNIENIETSLDVPVVLQNGWRERTVIMLGLVEQSQLYRVLDDDDQQVSLTADGIYLSQHLADVLAASVGMQLTLNSPYLRDDHDGAGINVYVAGVIKQSIGSNAYMNRQLLSELLGQGDVITTVMLAKNDQDLSLLRERYRESPVISAIEDKNQSMRQVMELMDSFSYTTWIMVFFAAACGFAIIYSTSIIALSERERELASLRVIGMSPLEVFQVLSFEQWLVSSVAMVLGIPLAYAMTESIAQSIDVEFMSLAVNFQPSAFILAGLGTIISILAAQLSVYKRINKLSLVDVLKERD